MLCFVVCTFSHSRTYTFPWCIKARNSFSFSCFDIFAIVFLTVVMTLKIRRGGTVNVGLGPVRDHVPSVIVEI